MWVIAAIAAASPVFERPVDETVDKRAMRRQVRKGRIEELRYYRNLGGQQLPEVATRQALEHAYSVPNPGGGNQPPLEGFADLHAHVFSDRGFGGRAVLAGTGRCDGGDHGLRWGITRNITLAGPEVLEDPMMAQLLRHCPTSELPSFRYWTHDQYAVEALRQAHVNGLNLIVISAVNAQILCGISEAHQPDVEGRFHIGRDSRDAFDCGDAVNLHRQIAHVWELAEQESSWLEVVLSPQGARDTMSRGKLAVVIGVEASDYLGAEQYGGIAPDEMVRECNGRRLNRLRFVQRNPVGARNTKHTDPAVCAALADTVVTRLRNLGVRVVIPIHEWTNDVGGAATHNIPLFQATYAFLQRSKRVDEAKFPGIGFLLYTSQHRYEKGKIWKWPMPLEAATDPYDARAYYRNARGLTPYGRALTSRLLHEDGGGDMILDLSHFSDRTLADLEEITDGPGSTPSALPLIVSHGSPRALVQRNRDVLEYPNSTEKYLYTARHGGLPAVMTSNELVGPVAYDAQDPGHPLPREVVCPGSVESVINAMQFVAQFSDVQAFGTDFNGGAIGTAPSTGPDACFADSASPGQILFGRVVQCLAPPDLGPGTDELRQRGMAHVGLLPQLRDAVDHVAGTDFGLNGSAERFVEVWSRRGLRFEPPPVIRSAAPVSTNDLHWRGDVTEARLRDCSLIGDRRRPEPYGVALGSSGNIKVHVSLIDDEVHVFANNSSSGEVDLNWLAEPERTIGGVEVPYGPLSPADRVELRSRLRTARAKGCEEGP
ncbi:MAG: membrane dipeptidase [Myxococcota bacterium]